LASRAAQARPHSDRAERESGSISFFETIVADSSLPDARGNFTYLERFLKFLCGRAVVESSSTGRLSWRNACNGITRIPPQGA
jgi:hypothetical protein